MTAQSLFEAAKRARDPQFGAIMAQKVGEAAILECGVRSPVELLPGAKRLLLWGERQVAFREGAR